MLVTCPDCGKEISSQAPTCPGCGRPMVEQPVATREKAGLLGRRGTGFGALNFGCAALIVGVLVLVAIIFLARLLG